MKILLIIKFAVLESHRSNVVKVIIIFEVSNNKNVTIFYLLAEENYGKNTGRIYYVKVVAIIIFDKFSCRNYCKNKNNNIVSWLHITETAHKIGRMHE